MRTGSHRSGESGVVLLTTLLILMMVVGADGGLLRRRQLGRQRATAIDRDQTQAYAVAHAGLEKLTSDLAQLFAADFSPSRSADPRAERLPAEHHRVRVQGAWRRRRIGLQGGFSKTDVNGNPCPKTPTAATSRAGPYKGLKGIITKYPITITARSTTGNAEVRLRRELQTVAVPVFQFGVFSETDLTFFAGDNFDFGGRVHTNGNLFLSNADGYHADLHRPHHGGQRDLSSALLERLSVWRATTSPAAWWFRRQSARPAET